MEGQETVSPFKSRQELLLRFLVWDSASRVHLMFGNLKVAESFDFFNQPFIIVYAKNDGRTVAMLR